MELYHLVSAKINNSREWSSYALFSCDDSLQPPIGDDGSRRRRTSSSAGDEGRRRRHPSNTTSKPAQASKSSSTSAESASASAAAQTTPKDKAQKAAATTSAQGKKTEARAGKKESGAPNKWSSPPVSLGLKRSKVGRLQRSFVSEANCLGVKRDWAWLIRFDCFYQCISFKNKA